MKLGWPPLALPSVILCRYATMGLDMGNPKYAVMQITIDQFTKHMFLKYAKIGD